MKILLDTHVIIWALTDDPRLKSQARNLLSSPKHLLLISAASLWEIAIKNQKAPDRCPYREDEILRYCMEAGMEKLPILPEHVLALRGLRIREGHQPANMDPFDRILLAQAKAEGCIFLSHDANLAHYREDCIRLI